MRRVLVAAAGGSLLAAAFPSPGLPFVAWIALAPLIWLSLTSSTALRAASEGFVFGISFHLLTFAWWYGLLRSYGGLSHPETTAVYLLMAFYIGLYGLLFGLAVRQVAIRWGAGPALLAAPALWAGLEALRGWLFTGLPWSVLGASQHPWPLFLQVADLGGAGMVSLVVASGNAVLAGLILRPIPGQPRVSWKSIALLALIPVLATLYGAVRMGQDWSGGKSLTVGLVQGSVPQDRKWAPSARLQILDDHLAATAEAAGRGASLVIWPESSVPLPITSTEAYRMLIETRARALGVDLLVGSVHYEDGPSGRPVYNSAFLIPRGGGPLQRYDKIRLVPFGEYVPFSRWLTPVEKIVEEASDFSPGGAPVIFDTGEARLGPFICFEGVFGGLVRRVTAGGAELLVNLTNDAMLGSASGPRQHLALAALRAVENRRWMVRAANTGISAVIDPAGRTVASAPSDLRAVIVESVPLLEGRSLYTAAGNWLGWGCGIVLALALSSSLFPGRKRI